MELATLVVWAKFIVCGGLIALAGHEVCRSADRIARATGLSGGWIGLALVAVVTSLPELASGVTAVTIASAPNIAVGNALGACVLNLMMVGVLDLLHRSEPLYRRIAEAHLLSAAFGVLLLGLAAFGVLLGASGVTGAPAALLYVGWYTPALFALYLVALRAVYLHDHARSAPQRGPDTPAADLRVAAGRFALAAVAVVGAGIWLPFLATDLAATLGWNRSFVGTVFVAMATTLPEMAVTVAALRIGAIDLAVGNLLGSNLFNVAIIAIDDLFYAPGPLLSNVSVVHAVTALSAVIMSALAIIGLTLRPTGRVLRTVSWISLGVLLIFLLNGLVVFLHGD